MKIDISTNLNNFNDVIMYNGYDDAFIKKLLENVEDKNKLEFIYNTFLNDLGKIEIERLKIDCFHQSNKFDLDYKIKRFIDLIKYEYPSVFEKHIEIILPLEEYPYDNFLYNLEKQLNNKKSKLNSIFLIKGENIKWFTNMLNLAINQKNTYEKTTSISNVISSTLFNKEIKKESKLSLLISHLKENEKKIDYILICDSDEYLNSYDIYTKINNENIKYREIIFSEGFKNYILENEFENSDFECFSDLMKEYIESELNVDFFEKIIEFVISLNNNEYCLTIEKNKIKINI